MTVQVCVPNNLNFEQLAQTFPFADLPTKERSAQFLYVFCGTLTALQAKRKFDKKDKGYTNMCAKWMRDIHAQSDLFIAYLIEAGVIECDGIFIEGQKCLGYKFGYSYRMIPYKEVEITDYRLKKAIRIQRQNQIAHRMENIKECMHIVKWYLNHRLTIDGAAARRWVQEYFEQSWEEIAPDTFITQKQSEELQILSDKCNAMRYFIKQIENKDYDEWEFSVDDKGKRLHGMFTFNKKELRMFTTYAGRRLVGIDLKNSQPYFSTLLLEPEFWQSKKVRTNKLQLLDIAPEMYKVFRADGTIRRIITMLESSQSLTQHNVSTGAYKSLAQSGEIYEFLLREMPKRLSPKFIKHHGCRIANRRVIKREMLRIMYSCNSDARKAYYETVRAFQSIFPRVARLFEYVKDGHYEWLPRILQRVESRLILQEICKTLAQEYPQMPLYTIHDSIVTTEGNEFIVKAVVERILTERVGCPPVLNFEYWKPENAYPIETNNNYICQNEEEFEEIEMR